MNVTTLLTLLWALVGGCLAAREPSLAEDQGVIKKLLRVPNEELAAAISALPEGELNHACPDQLRQLVEQVKEAEMMLYLLEQGEVAETDPADAVPPEIKAGAAETPLDL